MGARHRRRRRRGARIGPSLSLSLSSASPLSLSLALVLSFWRSIGPSHRPLFRSSSRRAQPPRFACRPEGKLKLFVRYPRGPRARADVIPPFCSIMHDDPNKRPLQRCLSFLFASLSLGVLTMRAPLPDIPLARTDECSSRRNGAISILRNGCDARKGSRLACFPRLSTQTLND